MKVNKERQLVSGPLDLIREKGGPGSGPKKRYGARSDLKPAKYFATAKERTSHIKKEKKRGVRFGISTWRRT